MQLNSRIPRQWFNQNEFSGSLSADRHVKGNNNNWQLLIKLLFWCVLYDAMYNSVYTKFSIVATICQDKTFIDKIICLMCLTHKARVIFEVNEISDHVIL